MTTTGIIGINQWTNHGITINNIKSFYNYLRNGDENYEQNAGDSSFNPTDRLNEPLQCDMTTIKYPSKEGTKYNSAFFLFVPFINLVFKPNLIIQNIYFV